MVIYIYIYGIAKVVIYIFSLPLYVLKILEGVTDIDLVVNLKLQEEALLAKCLGRRICNQCGGNFNIASISIKGENGRPGMVMAPLLPPAHCMSKLITRSDDTKAVVKERLRIYNEKCLTLSTSVVSQPPSDIRFKDACPPFLKAHFHRCKTLFFINFHMVLLPCSNSD
uniref:Adenylate kinase n=1 Tax=Glycine max TaxID=3847 RepID=K7MH71_SOYBN